MGLDSPNDSGYEDVTAVDPYFQPPSLPRFTTPERQKVVAWLQRLIAQYQFEDEDLRAYSENAGTNTYIEGRRKYVDCGITHYTALAKWIESQSDCVNDHDGD